MEHSDHLEPLWGHFVALWVDFGLTLEHFGDTLNHFGSTLVSLWTTLDHFRSTLDHFGSTLASLWTTLRSLWTTFGAHFPWEKPPENEAQRGLENGSFRDRKSDSHPRWGSIFGNPPGSGSIATRSSSLPQTPSLFKS